MSHSILQAIEKKSLKINFKGIGIGGGWVDPKESILVQPEFLHLSVRNFSVPDTWAIQYYTDKVFWTLFQGGIDRNLYLSSAKVAKQLVRALETEDYAQADILDDVLFSTLNKQGEINFNNVYAPSPYPDLEELQNKMNRYVKPSLSMVNQTIKWQYLSTEAYESLKKSFLVPSVSFCKCSTDKL